MAIRVLAVIVAICFTASVDAQKKKDPYKGVDNDVRLAALRHAQVWMPANVASADIRTGPTDVKSYPPGAEVTCDYMEEKLTGTPKFNCLVGPDDTVRVKYGEKNGEVNAEVAATRLLWALGFGADRVYPVTVVCKGCPEDPIKNHKKVDGTRTFTYAAIERKMPGDEIQLFKDSGWSWVELTFIDQAAGGASIVQRDALKLLAAMMQHTDNKPQQQRLMCLDTAKGLPAAPDGSCVHPVMMINDTGKTFGTATMFNNDAKSAVNFKEWSNTPVWKGDTGCVAQLSKSMTGSLEHPTIGEAGRKFLSGLLSQLSDQQLHDLFDVAQFAKRDQNTSVDDWVGAFKKKRDDISSRSCQS
jgi:hypothetical protein